MGFVPYVVLARIKRSVEVNLEVGLNGGQLLQYKKGGLEESEPVWRWQGVQCCGVRPHSAM